MLLSPAKGLLSMRRVAHRIIPLLIINIIGLSVLFGVTFAENRLPQPAPASPSAALAATPSRGVAQLAANEAYTVFLPIAASNFVPLPPAPDVTTSFGVNFISSAEARADETRYQRAADLGATINRWPLYWNRIEQNPISQPGVFSWAWQDENTINDIGHGLTIDAILLGIPPGLSTGNAASMMWDWAGRRTNYWLPEDASHRGVESASASVPVGLYLGVFDDGSDVPGAGKSINPNNRWARFVYAAVERYKPGGVLAQQQGWTDGEGIVHWEVWNEPDLDSFFDGTVSDYARMLKVAYLAARHADPNAKIIFGGLANFQKPNWLADTLNVIETYPDRDAHGWFFDALATHNYVWAWRTFYDLYRARVVLDAHGLTDKTLWLNETGVSVWNDPPGPINDPNALYRATMQEQAAFTIQSATFAVWMDAEAMLFFQLYDDFGNGCPGIDAYGLLRNEPDAACNPGDGTPRPAYFAYQTAIRYLSGLEPYWRKRPTIDQELVALKNPDTSERVISMWARDYFTETVVITATASSAILLYPDGITETLAPIGGVYTITLPAATNHNTPTTDGKAPIGGDPRILIEHDPEVATGE
jgi:hypothetical protein